MKCGILTNSKGDLLIVYDQGTPANIEWVEFHKDTGDLCIIYDSGQSQSLGLPLDAKTLSNIAHGMDVALVQIDDQKVVSSLKTTLIIHE